MEIRDCGLAPEVGKTLMRFVLRYRGPLRSNGNPSHKHAIRGVFHQQLKRLWSQSPLVEMTQLLEPRRPGGYCLLRQNGSFTFVPLVSGEMNVIAQLSIILLRPEAHGQLITQGGDIDNRLKTLFDALTVPRRPEALPSGISPTADQQPFFFCVLEDDNLVTSVSIKTEQLLEPVVGNSEVDVLIEIKTEITRHTHGNGSFG